MLPGSAQRKDQLLQVSVSKDDHRRLIRTTKKLKCSKAEFVRFSVTKTIDELEKERVEEKAVKKEAAPAVGMEEFRARYAKMKQDALTLGKTPSVAPPPPKWQQWKGAISTARSITGTAPDEPETTKTPETVVTQMGREPEEDDE